MADATTLEEVLARLKQLEGELSANDGARWFNRLYLRVTERVAEYVSTVPQAAPGFLERLDIVFANPTLPPSRLRMLPGRICPMVMNSTPGRRFFFGGMLVNCAHSVQWRV